MAKSNFRLVPPATKNGTVGQPPPIRPKNEDLREREGSLRRTGSLRTAVSVAGKRIFEGRDKELERASQVQERRCRDRISLNNPAHSGAIRREPGNRTMDPLGWNSLCRCCEATIPAARTAFPFPLRLLPHGYTDHPTLAKSTAAAPRA